MELSFEVEVRFSIFLKISCLLAAIDLISNLLQVKMRKRFTVDKSLSHVWLQVIWHLSPFNNVLNHNVQDNLL